MSRTSSRDPKDLVGVVVGLSLSVLWGTFGRGDDKPSLEACIFDALPGWQTVRQRSLELLPGGEAQEIMQEMRFKRREQVLAMLTAYRLVLLSRS